MAKYINQAGWERIVRILLGVVLLVLVLTQVVTGIWAILLGVVGAVAFLTGVTGVCPAYLLAKFRTNK